MRNVRLPYTLALYLLVVGCAVGPKKMSPMQFRQISTRLIEGNYDNTFRATMTVLQDNGYIIKQTDMAAGLITAEVNRETSGFYQFLQRVGSDGEIKDKGTLVEASAVVNRISDANTEVRITIQERTYSASGGTTEVRQLRDAEIYKNLFNNIIIEIKRREAVGL